MSQKPSPKIIVIVAFGGVQMLDVTGPSDVFAKVEQLRPGSYRLIIASPHGGEVVSNSGIVIGRTTALADLTPDIDTLLIAGSDEAGLRSAERDGLADWIKGVAPSIRRVGSVCTGAFVLAAAGLLDARRATTHWRSCSLLEDFCPTAQIESDAIYTVDPPIYTSAGVTAGIDLALALVEEDVGREIAAEVARELVLFVRRPGTQPQFSAGLAAQASAPDSLRDLLTWIVDNPSADLSVAALALRVGMSERNFGRAFRERTGKTPGRLVEQTRLEHACDLLQRSDWSIDRIAAGAGFGSTDALYGAFRRNLGTTPAKYRKKKG